ncbi:hypothetical protein SBRY_90222 [Actinacidiphila bryophytorum]|uniref:Uncharacterized protein n=1 Tax=Actinacidiphila bryophytorum TaxID=1436133 RepID=A0A9W4MIC6_9ACTN|nr:hypothetical protein SBRY_90222 [Actinacidiphila bryophytorum]
MHRRQVAHQLAQVGPRQHRAQRHLPAADLVQRLDEPALRHLARAPADAGRRALPPRAARGADRAEHQRRGDPVPRRAGGPPQARGIPADHRAGRGLARRHQPGEPVHQLARRRLPAARHARPARRGVHPARHPRAVAGRVRKGPPSAPC